MDDIEIKKLKKEMEVVNSKLEKITSFKFNFLLSVVKGVGTVLGASIVAAIIIALISQILQYLGLMPIFESIIKQ